MASFRNWEDIFMPKQVQKPIYYVMPGEEPKVLPARSFAVLCKLSFSDAVYTLGVSIRGAYFIITNTVITDKQIIIHLADKEFVEVNVRLYLIDTSSKHILHANNSAVSKLLNISKFGYDILQVDMLRYIITNNTPIETIRHYTFELEENMLYNIRNSHTYLMVHKKTGKFTLLQHQSIDNLMWHGKLNNWYIKDISKTTLKFNHAQVSLITRDEDQVLLFTRIDASNIKLVQADVIKQLNKFCILGHEFSPDELLQIKNLIAEHQNKKKAIANNNDYDWSAVTRKYYAKTPNITIR